MNQEQFEKHVNDELTLISELLVAKNKDYGGVGDDVLENVKMCEKLGICSPEQGILIRMTDKYKRLINLFGSGKVPNVISEKEEDTIRDLFGYLILILAVKKDRAGLIKYGPPYDKAP